MHMKTRSMSARAASRGRISEDGASSSPTFSRSADSRVVMEPIRCTRPATVRISNLRTGKARLTSQLCAEGLPSVILDHHAEELQGGQERRRRQMMGLFRQGPPPLLDLPVSLAP